jgi:hypothetical protein
MPTVVMSCRHKSIIITVVGHEYISTMIKDYNLFIGSILKTIYFPGGVGD